MSGDDKDMWIVCVFVFLMIRRPPRSTQSRSSAASDVYKRQFLNRQYTVWGQVISGMEFVDKIKRGEPVVDPDKICLLYTSPSPRDRTRSRMPSSA